MKNLVCFLTFIVSCGIPFVLSAQEKFDVTGVWVGQIFNDSTKQYLPFELAISRKNLEFTGYTYTVFLIDSVENVGVKEVTIKEEHGKYVIKDKKLIDNNYREKPAKGVYTTFELLYTDNDTVDVLAGKWFTNKTKLYYPLSGTAYLTRKKRIYETKIVPRLSHLGLANTLSFVTPNHKYDDEPSVALNKKNKASNGEEMMTIVEPELVIEVPKKDSGKSIKLTDLKEISAILESAGVKETDKEVAVIPDSSHKNQTVQESRKVDSLKEMTVMSGKQNDTSGIIEKPVTGIHVNRPLDNKKASTLKPVNEPIRAPEDLAKRKIETIRAVQVAGDSIILSLFDNGTIDGDTVSVILNDQVIISKVGLLATAYNHTLHLTPEMGDSIKLILYAENLGSIPPNTGLLVVRDGKTNHEIRFSGDLNKNSAIILLRNKER